MARGGFKGRGDVTVRGSGWGLVKIAWKHGPMSGKDKGIQVRRDDIVRFPRIVRDYAPQTTADGQRRWVVERDDGKRVLYADRAFAEDGKRRLVTVHVLRDPESFPLSVKRTGAAGSPDGRSKPYGDTAAEDLNARPSDGPSAPATKSMDPRTPPRKPLPPSLRPPAAPRPKSLGTWLAREGGIDDSAVDYEGWLRRMEAHRHRPGLVNTQAGMPLDDAALRAWEAGYFPGATERPTINDLLDALDEDLRGGPVATPTATWRPPPHGRSGKPSWRSWTRWASTPQA